MTADEVKNLITAKINCEHCEVEGDGRHWYATIVSSQFEGLHSIARHQRIYQAVEAEIANDKIHALSLKTYTHSEWAQL